MVGAAKEHIAGARCACGVCPHEHEVAIAVAVEVAHLGGVRAAQHLAAGTDEEAVAVSAGERCGQGDVAGVGAAIQQEVAIGVVGRVAEVDQHVVKAVAVDVADHTAGTHCVGGVDLEAVRRWQRLDGRNQANAAGAAVDHVTAVAGKLHHDVVEAVTVDVARFGVVGARAVALEGEAIGVAGHLEGGDFDRGQARVAIDHIAHVARLSGQDEVVKPVAVDITHLDCALLIALRAQLSTFAVDGKAIGLAGQLGGGQVIGPLDVERLGVGHVARGRAGDLGHNGHHTKGLGFEGAQGHGDIDVFGRDVCRREDAHHNGLVTPLERE